MNLFNIKRDTNKVILQILLGSPRVYSGLDHLMVEVTKQAADQGYTNVCVYSDTMEHMPQLQQDIESAGGKVELVRSSNLLQDIWHLYQKYCPTIVDTHFVNKVKLWTCIFSLLFDAKHYTHIHSQIGPKVHEYINRKGIHKRVLLGMYYHFLGICSKKILCVSELNRVQYTEWSYGAKNKAITLYMGTQIHEPSYAKLEARNILQIPLNEYVITNVSAIEAIKGIDLIIKSVALLKQNGLNVLFAHIGGLRENTSEQQQYADSLKQLVRKLGIEDNIVWLGRRNDISDILSFADCYVHPSWTEGLPSALMEAAMAGLPLIATRAGGMPEIVIDKYNGRLIESGDYYQLAKCIEQVLTTKHDYGEKAREIVYRMFDQTKQASNLLDLYNIATHQ